MSTESIKYSSLIPYKISQILSLIIENNQSNFISALSYLYKSKLYDYLSDETTKLWHLSAEKLFDMLEEEKKHGKLQFPDFV
jgi:hypothetical protein